MPVDAGDWIRENKAVWDESGWRAVPRTAYYAYLGLWFTVASRLPLGQHVYERDWDLLVVLDACRVDAVEAVADEYDFVETVDTITSVGTSSEEWLGNTFTRDHEAAIADTAMLSANGYTQELFETGKEPPSRRPVPVGAPSWDIVDAGDFGLLDHVWRYGRDETLDQVPPRVLTDRAIEVGRSGPYDRLVVHYLQPHSPYIARAIWEDRAPTEQERDSRAAYNSGELSAEGLRELYRDNLRLVLDEVELLVENVDAETVAITADHGELLGELRVYGHPSGLPHPDLIRVPWIETTATDRGTRDPEPVDRSGRCDVTDHLEALGYR